MEQIHQALAAYPLLGLAISFGIGIVLGLWIKSDKKKS